MVNSCCVTGCNNESYPGSRFSFHGFPKNESQKLKWENAVPGKISKSSVVCSAHFKCEDFMPGYTRKMLKADAVPSIFPNLPNDMENYMRYHVMGFVNKVMLKPDSLPSRFQCQTDRDTETVIMTLPFRETEKKDMMFNLEPESMIKPEPVEPDPVPELEPDPDLEPILEPKSEPVCELKPRCTQCQEVLFGFVFACIECDARECEACDARALHAAHLVLRAPSARPESELALVLNKIRDALYPGTSQTNSDQPVEESPEYESIKMEIDTEEYNPLRLVSASGAPANTDEEIIVPDIEHQSSPWAGRGAAGGSRGLSPRGGYLSDSSCTLTASIPSDSSSSDDDQTLLVGPRARAQPSFTDDMNRYIVRTYYMLSLTEKNPRKIFTLMKQAFAIAYPHFKVRKLNLQTQFSIIFINKLFSDHEIQMIRKDVYSSFKTANYKTNITNVSRLITGKGRRLELLTVRSGKGDTGIQMRGNKRSTVLSDKSSKVLSAKNSKVLSDKSSKVFSDKSSKVLSDKSSKVNPRPSVRKVVVPIPVSSKKPNKTRKKANKRVSKTVAKKSSDQKRPEQPNAAKEISDSPQQQTRQSSRGSRTRRLPARLLT